MKNFCTVSDKNYLHLGLAMHESLGRSSCEYKLYYFCVDNETYTFLCNYNDERIIPISIESLLKTNEDLQILKSVEASYEAKAVSNIEGIHSPNQWQFLYSLSTFTVNYCLRNLNLEHIMYIDADIFFFEDFIYAFNDIGNRSVGVVEHRLLTKNPAGQFNVGIVYFKNDITGLGASDFWLKCMKDPNNEFSVDYGSYGDQKYLELVYEGSGEDAVIIGDTCGHLAPWNIPCHQYDNDKKMIVWKGKRQKLVYWHFSSFVPNFQEDTYVVGKRHGIYEINISFIREKTDIYFNTIKKYKKSLEN
jgi:hypothetical protein